MDNHTQGGFVVASLGWLCFGSLRSHNPIRMELLGESCFGASSYGNYNHSSSSLGMVRLGKFWCGDKLNSCSWSACL